MRLDGNDRRLGRLLARLLSAGAEVRVAVRDGEIEVCKVEAGRSCVVLAAEPSAGLSPGGLVKYEAGAAKP